MSKVTIIGAGYVGLPTAAHWSTVHDVVVYDIMADKIQLANDVISGKKDQLHIHEGGLVEKLRQNKNNLTFTTDKEKALMNSELIFVAAGTPENKKGRANLEYVVAAAKEIGQNINNNCIVINKSTCPPGTAYLVEDTIKEELKKRNLIFCYNVSVGSCPEFLAEGTAMKNLHSPDRIVYGSDDESTLKYLRNFFTALHPIDKLVEMDTVSAEVTKYVANCALAKDISFMNQFTELFDIIGANTENVRRGIVKDSRLGSFYRAGMGYGGSCFGKDTSAIYELAKIYGIDLSIIGETINVNKGMPIRFHEKINSHFGETYTNNLEGKTFGLWGIGFKANTDDLRDSKSVELANDLMECGAKLHIFDNIRGALDNFPKVAKFENYTICKDQYDIPDIDGLIIGNEAELFRSPNPSKLNMKHKVIFDGKNCISDYVVHNLKEEGFIYKSIGRDVLGKPVDKQMLIDTLRDKYMS
ncbi:nucleotide sugar dehydrogenase [Candidatus Woesearchaeota archaeon]|nr:nucleotide sugar dehydrogenase [Candidatus Woesearchaeota archaeon]